MIVLDLANFLEQLEAAIARGARNPTIFAGELVIGTLAKLPVERDPRVLVHPATMLAQLPVYLHPMMVPSAIMLLQGDDVTATLAAIATANAVAEQPHPRNFS